MVKDIVALTVTQAAVDQKYGTLITQASNDDDREVIMVGYTKGTNTTAVFPQYLMIAPQPPTESDGTWLIGSGATASPCVAYVMNVGSSTANTDDAWYSAWPTSAKINCAGRWILPAGWAIIAAPLDADMDGTIIHRVITRAVE